MSNETEVFIDLNGLDILVGQLHREPRQGYEAVGFQYDDQWLARKDAFSLEPALVLAQGAFSPASGRAVLGSIGDSAPDTWGRQLMRRAERRKAADEKRIPRTLQELDYLLGVTDIARSGALRFTQGAGFLAPAPDGVPSIIHLQRLLEATDRTLRDEETAADLRLILAPGSSLGGARPKASVTTADGNLAIAKFPKETDEYSLETWEAVALTLAAQAGINTAKGRLVDVAGRNIIVIDRFDREAGQRIPMLSAMAMLDLQDGEPSSYPEIVDAIMRYGARPQQDAAELYRRMAFNMLISNVDDHLRNHAFLWNGSSGWTLSPAYDLNPTPVDVRERRLTTNITLDDGTCDLELVLEVAGFFGLSTTTAQTILREVAVATSTWKSVAAAFGATKNQVQRMSSAFEHTDLEHALSL